MTQRKKTKREMALEVIKVEYAKHGKCTETVMRLYVENRISYKVLQETARIGLAMYDANETKKEAAVR